MVVGVAEPDFSPGAVAGSPTGGVASSAVHSGRGDQRAVMTERDTYEALFLDNLAAIDRATASVCRVLGFRGDDADEFASWAKARLWDDDYALLRKWRRESALTTYLAVVLVNLGREFRVKRWGRWRPSAAALRAGTVAVSLERLVYRDGMRLDEAGTVLRARGETSATDRELGVLLASLPRRTPTRVVDDGGAAADAIPGDDAADDATLDAEQDAERRYVYGQLATAIASLASQEQIVIKASVLGGRSLADVARALGVEQKPLYRVREAALRTLARHLEAHGVTWPRVRDVLGAALPAEDGEPRVDRLWETEIPQPSKQTRPHAAERAVRPET